MSDELSLIKAELWDVLRAVREGELETEDAETIVSVIDSLIEATRLERLYLRSAEKKQHTTEHASST